MVLGEHFNQFVEIFLLVNSVASSEADQTILIKNPRQILSMYLNSSLGSHADKDNISCIYQWGYSFRFWQGDF